MKTKRTERDEEMLRDPALTAMLRDAFADDPASMAAPGRSDRIMRKVLASGVRPVAHTPWNLVAWGAGACAALAVIALLFFAMPSRQSIARKPVVVPAPTNSVKRPPEPVLVTVPERQEPAWEGTPTASTKSMKQVSRRTPRRERPAAIPAPPAESPTQVAAALYSAGTAATASGDYESAYTAYQASYEMSPTPDALLASGKALEQMAQDTLRESESSS